MYNIISQGFGFNCKHIFTDPLFSELILHNLALGGYICKCLNQSI